MKVGVCINEVVNLGSGWNRLLIELPDLVLQNLTKNKFDKQVLLCPAVKQSLRNTFAVRAPFDMRVVVDRSTGYTLLEANPTNGDGVRLPLNFNENSKSMTLEFPSFSLLSNQDTDVEVLYPVYDTSEFTENFSVAMGRFNIHKWIRPLGVGIIPLKDSIDITIPKGTVLMYIRITPKDNSTVKLVWVEESTDIATVKNACLSVKKFVKTHSLIDLYTMYTRAYKLKKWKL